MIVKTPEQRDSLIEAGRRLGVILDTLAAMVAPGVSTETLEEESVRLITEGGDVPVFLNYTPQGARRPYPASLCVSINDEVVHGIPNEAPRVLKEGDIIALDLGLTHEGIVVDSALTVPVGKISKDAAKLISATQGALENAIQAAKVGGRVGDISNAIEVSYKGTGFSVVRDLGGHGVGNSVHEEPWVANFGHAGTGPELVEGHVLALEPIANTGKAGIMLAQDGYTYRTKDGSISAHFEHTVLLEKEGPLVVTRRPSEA